MSILFPDKEPLIKYSHKLRSRYGETDKMGYVYYGRYLEYFEVARTEMIRSFGFSYRELEDKGVMLPVIHSELEYKQPIHYDVEMEIKVMVYDIADDLCYKKWRNHTMRHLDERVKIYNNEKFKYNVISIGEKRNG